MVVAASDRAKNSDGKAATTDGRRVIGIEGTGLYLCARHLKICIIEYRWDPESVKEQLSNFS